MSSLKLFESYKIYSNYSPDHKLVVHTGDIHSFIKEIPNASIKLIVTSPPYNIGKQYETTVALDEYLASQELLIRELVRVLACDGSICWQVGNYVKKGEIFPLDIYFYPMFKNLGLKLRNRVIWHFGHGYMVLGDFQVVMRP